MSKLDAEQIVNVVDALVGDITAHGETQTDTRNRDNQKVLTEVIDILMWMVIKNTNYVNRREHSMWLIGNDAKEFLGYLVDEYELNDYAKGEEE